MNLEDEPLSGNNDAEWRRARISALSRAVRDRTYDIPAEVVADSLLRHWRRSGTAILTVAG